MSILQKHSKKFSIQNDIYVLLQNIFSLDISVGAIYVRKYFNEVSKKTAVNLANMIREEFLKTLKQVSWMDDESKKAAIGKANAMHFHIAYPNELIDNNKLEEYYRDVELEPDSLIHSVLSIRKSNINRMIRQLRELNNKTNWEKYSSSAEVNAFYTPSENGIGTGSFKA